MHRAWVEVDLEALGENVEIVRRLAPSSEIMAIVKADAYGLGAREIAGHLARRCSVKWFGVANVVEALKLTAWEVPGRCLVLSDPLKEEMPEIVRHGFDAAVSSLETASLLDEEARRQARPAAVHVKADTGMGRFGATAKELSRILRFAASSEHLKVEGLYTHLAEADTPETGSALEQIRLFALAGREALSICPGLKYFHAANSAGILSFPDAHLNMVRPGLMLYGMHSSKERHTRCRLSRVFSVRARLLAKKEIGQGATVGYGATFRAPENMPIGVVAVGYAQGYFRIMSGKAEMLVCGQRVPMIGRISMDYSAIDLRHAPHAQVGDAVTLIGRDGDEEIMAEDVAAWSSTIAYEVSCSLGSRLPRLLSA